MRFARNLSILIYHRVLAQRDPLFPGQVDAITFDKQLCLLKRYFTVLPLLEAVRRLNNGTLPPNAACITFDDGYADNAEVALPLLMRHGLSACFFIATGYLDGGQMWNDKIIETVRRAPGDDLDLSKLGLENFPIFPISTHKLRCQTINSLLSRVKYLPIEQRETIATNLLQKIGRKDPPSLMMKSEQVAMLHRVGMEIGAHTVNHPILSTLSEQAAHSNISEGKKHLESIIKSPVHIFAYPNGIPDKDYNERDVRIVKKLGFKAAVATNWGVARHDSDIFQLPRFTPWDRNSQRFLLRMWLNLFRQLS
jgi:peptidoglycan/xylan/chitin deacetylase (PgdA/CDA1 family)